MKGLSKDAVNWLKVDESAEGQRIDNFLARHLKGVPKSHVYRILRSGEVRLNKARIGPDARLAIGDVVRIPPIRTAASRERSGGLGESMPADLARGSASPGRRSVTGADRVPPSADRAHVPGAIAAGRALARRILFEDDAFLAIDKPAGLAVHGGSGIAHGLIEQLRIARPQARMLELVHRLDRDTSGVLLVAKQRPALVALHAQLRNGDVDKRYLVLVRGRWRDERRIVRLSLHKFSTREGERRVRVDDEGQQAVTVFRRQRVWPEHEPPLALLEAELKTGRTHQIRVHLTHLGFPLAGDDKYGDFVWNRGLAKQGLKRMFLHAWKLEFAHPVTGVEVQLVAPLPDDLARFVMLLDVDEGSDPASRDSDDPPRIDVRPAAKNGGGTTGEPTMSDAPHEHKGKRRLPPKRS